MYLLFVGTNSYELEILNLYLLNLLEVSVLNIVGTVVVTGIVLSTASLLAVETGTGISTRLSTLCTLIHLL